MAFVIPTIFTAVNRLTQPLAQMKSGLMSFTNEVSAANAAFALQMSETAAMGQQLAATSGAAAIAIIAPLGLATKAAIDFQKQMTNVATLVDTTRENMKDMGQEVINVASKIPVPLEDLTTSLYQIRSAGIAASQAMEVLSKSAMLSVAGLSTAKEATDAVISAMVNFKNQELSVTQITDVFMNTVKMGKTTMAGINEAFGSNALIVAQSGVSLQEFMASVAALTNTGIPASQAMNSITASIISLNKPTTEMATVFENLGVLTGRQLIDKMGGLVPALVAINNEVKKAKPGVLEMNKVFGRKESFVSSTALTGVLADSYKNIASKMDLAGANAESFNKQMETTDAQIQITKNAFNELGITIGDKLLGVVGIFGTIIRAGVQLLNFVLKIPILGSLIVNLTGAFGGLLGVLALVGVGMMVYGKAMLFAKSAMISMQAPMMLYRLTMWLSTVSTWGLVAAIGALTLGLSIVFASLNSGYNEMVDYNSLLEDTKNNFAKITDPINAATLALQNYNDAVKDYNQYQNYMAYDKFVSEQGTTWQKIKHALDFSHPIMDFQNFTGMAPEKPETSKYMTEAQVATVKANNEIVINAYIDQNGKIIADANGNVKVKINNGITTKSTTGK